MQELSLHHRMRGSKDYNAAAELIREISPLIGGGGGGSDEMAQAGGKKPDGIEDALAAARAFLEAKGA